ncbi:MAG: sec-independent protein translocase protein TatC [Gaiellaceae bacterium]|nr:sec-independent protein translocase protein TatC [Gaiellaceae bacterium]
MHLPRRLGHGQHAELVDHLDELRSRLLVSLVAVVASFAVSYAFHARLLAMLESPLPAGKKLVTFGVTEPFMTSLQVSLVGAIAIALPVLLWQAWSYFAPAIDPRVQRTVMIAVVAATVLFAVGLVFAYEVAMPAAVRFLTTYDQHIYNINVRAKDYISFTLAVLVSVGLVFELPAVIVALVRIGIVEADQLRRNRRIGYVAVAALAVALPGVDPVTTAFEMAPLMILFEASIWVSVAVERRVAARAPAAGTAM